jgi:hypothetical protein
MFAVTGPSYCTRIDAFYHFLLRDFFSFLYRTGLIGFIRRLYQQPSAFIMHVPIHLFIVQSCIKEEERHILLSRIVKPFSARAGKVRDALL